MKRQHPGAWALVLTGVLAAFLGGACDSPTGSASSSRVAVRALPADLSTWKAVSYSGYRGSSNSAAPTQAQIDQDLDLLDRAGFRYLRFFSSSDSFTKVTLDRIRHFGYNMKVQLGIWIQGTARTNSESDNQAEIARGIALAKDYSDIVAAVSVGNEKMVDWQSAQDRVAPTLLLSYISQVRNAVTQPVTTDDNWAVFANIGTASSIDPILAAIDFVSMHTYPLADSMHVDYDVPTATGFWDWLQLGVAEGPARATAMMNAALGKAQKDYNTVAAYLSKHGFADRPIVIGETGWKSSPSGNEEYRAHPINQKMYYDLISGWKNGPASIIYFEAFDEPWKVSDDMWGLWDVNRKAKNVLYSLFPAATDQATTTGNAVYYIKPPTRDAVTAHSYSLYQEVPEADAAVPGGNLTPVMQWIGWNNPWTASGALVTASGADTAREGSEYLRITPSPDAGLSAADAATDWGWGFFLYIQNLENLSNFSNGHLRFSVRTTYPGKIEVGFFTKSSVNTGTTDVYMPIGSGDYGYKNDGTWADVALPIATLKTFAATPGSFDLAKVAHAITIADRYAKTGKALGTNDKTPIDIDNIRWTRD